MNIEITSETERVVREELQSGHFQSVDELILSGVYAWREKNAAIFEARTPPKNLVAFFRDSPLVGLELDFSRDKDDGQEILL